MSLPRKHNLEQMKKLRKITKGKDIGDIVSKSEKNKEHKMPNSYWIDNPFDRKIDTYESFIKKDNKIKTTNENLDFEKEAFIIWENYLIENEDFVNKNYMNIDLIIDDIIKKNEYRNDIKYMKDDIYDIIQNYLEMEMVQESFYNKGKGPGNTDLFNTSFKQVLTSFNSPSILQIGKQVKVGKINGYIDSVDSEYVYISTLDGNKEKISFKKFLKELEKEGTINENSGLPSEFWMEYEPHKEEEYDDIEIDVLEDDDDTEELEEYETEYEDKYNQKQRPLRPPGIPKYPKPGIVKTPKEMPNDFPKEFSSRKGNIRGTEDDPYGLNQQRNENVYVNDFKSVKCDDCGEMVENTVKAKLAHIYNKHFNKPEMDGQVPDKKYSYGINKEYGGKRDLLLMKKYFPKY